ncbi:MAG: 3-phosphoshikimate 1-carboxyvinyltransferase [Actinobacteria bacterium]|nr:3-phosphoshikimate 1-carboxyvinyltransferase [Actinomycetota bacterium]
MPDPLTVEPLVGTLDTTVTIPGSKSITNRALVCAALATGTSTLTGLLDSDDTNAMVSCLRAIGIDLDLDLDAARATVRGSAGTVPATGVTLDANQSGTTARFMLAVAALADGPLTIDGHPQMRGRPMADGIEAVEAIGRTVVSAAGSLPITVTPGGSDAASIRVRGDVSSQFLTGLLLAAPCLPNGLEILVEGHLQSAPYVAMTITVMEAFGARVDAADAFDRFVVHGTGYDARTYAIEPDASAASYPLAIAALCGGRVTVAGLGRDSLQGDIGFAEVLARYGASVELAADSVTVTGGRLLGGSFDMAEISDTAQTLAAIAPFAEAPTEITGIGFIRRKETDRIGAVVTELRRLGVNAVELDDGLRVEPGAVGPGVVRTYEDHRMAMSFAVLGMKAGVQIADPACVSKTFPTYWQMLESLRASATIDEAP